MFVQPRRLLGFAGELVGETEIASRPSVHVPHPDASGSVELLCPRLDRALCSVSVSYLCLPHLLLVASCSIRRRDVAYLGPLDVDAAACLHFEARKWRRPEAAELKGLAFCRDPKAFCILL